MKEQLQYFGYAISEDLYNRAGSNIQKTLSGDINAALVEEITNTLIHITDIGLQAYYQRPRDLIEISPVVKKAADAGINAVMKGVHIVVRKVIQRAPETELQKMALYMKSLLTMDDNGNHYITFQLNHELYSLSQELLERVRVDSDVDTYREDIVEALFQLIDAGIDAYYHQPVGMIDLGKLTKKTADVGIRTAQKGTNSVIKRVFKVLDHEEMVPLTRYFESLLHSNLSSYNH